MTNQPDDLATEIPRLMNMPGNLTFTAEGRWLHAGEEITHEKIKEYFSRHLRYSEAHAGYVVEVDGRCVRAEVEDTAVVVRTIDTSTSPWTAYLSGDLEEEFRAATLWATSSGIFYSLTLSNSKARLLRPATQSIEPFLDESEGGFELRVGKERFPIRVREE